MAGLADIEVITGKDCTVQLSSGAIGNWTSYKIEITTQKEAAQPAAKKIYRQCTIYRHCKITLEGFRGGTETFGSLATVDTPCVPVFTDPPPNFADFTNWRIGDANMNQPAGPGTYSMTLEQGFAGTTTAIGAGASSPS